ncbi:MAG: Maltose/maltodextrin transport ATP-binding protein MalK, partial [uncultured Pseudonocardia sp.]
GFDRDEPHRQAVRGRLQGGQRRQPGHRRRRVHDPRRAVRLREVHAAAHDRRAGGHHQRRHDHRWAAGQRQGAPRPQPVDGVPELRAVPAPVGVREHRVPAAAGQHPRRRGRPARQGGRVGAGAARAPGAQASEPVRRAAPARRDGPRDRPPGRGVPVRRAAVQPRRQAARPDAHRDRAAAAPAGHHHGLRHPRPDRGHDAGRPGVRAAQGRHPAGGLPAGALRAARQPVRGRVHRLPADELPARRGAGQLAGDPVRADPAGREAGVQAHGPRPGHDRHPARVLRGRRVRRRGQAAARLGLHRPRGRQGVAGRLAVRLHPLRGARGDPQQAARAVEGAGLRGAPHAGDRVDRREQPAAGGPGRRVLARHPPGARLRPGDGRQPHPRRRGRRRADPPGRAGPGGADGGRAGRRRRQAPRGGHQHEREQHQHQHHHRRQWRRVVHACL